MSKVYKETIRREFELDFEITEEELDGAIPDDQLEDEREREIRDRILEYCQDETYWLEDEYIDQLQIKDS